MTLPSQVGRTSGPGARVVTRKRRGGKKSPFKLIVLLIIIGVGGYFAWKKWGDFDNSRGIENITDQNIVTNEPYKPILPSSNISPLPNDNRSSVFPMPSSTAPELAAAIEPDPLLYDTLQNVAPKTPSQPKFIALPEVSVDSFNPKSPAIAPKPVKTPNVFSTPTMLDAEPLPVPVPGTPQLAPAAPVIAENAGMAQQISHAVELFKQGNKTDARARLSYLLFERFDELAQSHASIIRKQLKEINDDLVFSKRVIDNDPIAKKHLVRQGEYLGPLAKSYKLNYPFLERINRVKATRMWAGMKIKVFKGPFHAIVYKNDYLMDVFLKDDQGNKVYVATYAVGLGEQDSTPIGTWRVRPNSKVENPSWPDPRSGKVYQPDDPENPIGEYWVGLQGIDENTQGKKGYGIHGTTDAKSIGQQMSMGCIRMRADDLVWVYHMLVDKDSTVTIRR